MAVAPDVQPTRERGLYKFQLRPLVSCSSLAVLLPSAIYETTLDTYSNVAAGYSGTTHFSTTDLQAVLPPNSTLTNGTGTFSATLKMVANTTITATDSAASSISGASTSINVFSNAATHFIINAPSGTTTRASISFIVSALDGANNLSTVYAGTVHFSSTDTKALLPSNSALSNGTGLYAECATSRWV